MPAKEVGGHSFKCLIMKERPCHVYSDSMSLKQTVMYNRAASGFKVKS